MNPQVTFSHSLGQLIFPLTTVLEILHLAMTPAQPQQTVPSLDRLATHPLPGTG